MSVVHLLLEQDPHHALVVLPQLVEGAPVGLAVRDRVGLGPVAASVLAEEQRLEGFTKNV